MAMIMFVGIVWGLGRQVCGTADYKEWKESKQTEVPVANQEPFLIQYAESNEKYV